MLHVVTRTKDTAPRDLSCRVIRSHGAELAVLSFTPSSEGRLTEAERDVALAVARGLSNGQIAKARGASARTIANQLAAIMKKLGVSSRVELAAQLGVMHFL